MLATPALKTRLHFSIQFTPSHFRGRRFLGGGGQSRAGLDSLAGPHAGRDAAEDVFTQRHPAAARIRTLTSARVTENKSTRVRARVCVCVQVNKSISLPTVFQRQLQAPNAPLLQGLYGEYLLGLLTASV